VRRHVLSYSIGMADLPPLSADEVAFVRAELANSLFRRDALEEPLFLKRYRSGARQGEIRERGAQALIDDGSLMIVHQGDAIIRVVFTERGLRRLAAALADRRAFPDARFSWLRGELRRLIGEWVAIDTREPTRPIYPVCRGARRGVSGTVRWCCCAEPEQRGVCARRASRLLGAQEGPARRLP
jgi:hypothetical protein